MNFAIYSRKSVYTGKGESVENQIEMCRQYIFQNFDGIVDSDITIYEDEGFSGKNIDRPQFQKMLGDIKEKKLDCVVCYRLDRISRNVSDFATLIEDLNDRSISFVSIKENFSSNTPMGRAVMYIASVFAQLERETIAERVRDNMLMLARTGRWLGGTTPTGFTSEKTQEIIVDGKVKSACKLKVDPCEINVVKLMFNKFLELHSISGVSKYLIKNNIKSRMGKIYSPQGIKEILQNPVYCTADKDAYLYFMDNNADVCFNEKNCTDKMGLLSYNKRDYKKKSAPRQPIERWIIAIGKHKGIVPGKSWVMVQNVLEQNKPNGKTPAKMHNDYSLLSGMIYCTKCGERMFAKARSNNPEVFDYICSSKLRGGLELCDCQNLNGQHTDDIVCEYLLKYTNEGSEIFDLLNKLKDDLAKEERQNPHDEINRKIQKCNKEMDNLITTLSKGNLGKAFVQRINQKITELDKEATELIKQREQLVKSTQSVADKEMKLDILATALSSLKDNFMHLTIQEKRILIKLLVNKMEWDGKNLHIFIYGE